MTRQELERWLCGADRPREFSSIVHVLDEPLAMFVESVLLGVTDEQSPLRFTVALLRDIFTSDGDARRWLGSPHCEHTETNTLLKNTMNTTIAVTKAVTKAVTTLIHILTVEPEDQEKLIQLLRENTHTVVTRLDGWISTSVIAADDRSRVAIHSQWRDLAAVEAMRIHPEMVAYFPRIAALAAFDGFAGDVVYTRHARPKQGKTNQRQRNGSCRHRRQPTSGDDCARLLPNRNHARLDD
jgi:quinol monooxygenase YgiN